MSQMPRSPLHSSVFAIVVTAVAVLLSFVFGPFLSPDAYLLFLAAVWLSTWYHGRTGGFVSAAFATLVFVFYYFGSGLSRDPSPVALRRILSFLVLSVGITWLTDSWLRGRRLLASALSSVGDALLATDRQGRVIFLNPVAEALTGWPAKLARGKNAGEVLRLIDESRRQSVENPIALAVRERMTVTVPERPLLVSRSGTEVPVEQTAAPIRDDSGEVLGGIIVFRDISKRRQLEERESHAQKMEAVGRLAGGVASDFNNTLTVIAGYAELLRSEIASSNPLRRFVDEIIWSADRSAGLTRHLLAFRGGAGVQTRVVDLNAVVTGMEPMLKRLLGHSIELIFLPGGGLGHVRTDPEQIELVLINLLTNAREAMPEGGKVVIESANIEVEVANGRNLGLNPGSYVMLAVSDTGVGMDTETRSRLFEPFFTTKPSKGSGLGLATVYGIVKQCQGQITVYSQPGCGTIFEIYLPQVAGPVTPELHEPFPKGSETIMIVDDEESVRQVVSDVLKSHGYDVVEAGDAGAALAECDKRGRQIDLVLTEVVMPQMSGLELGRELAAREPRLKILYMSGYRDALARAAPEGAAATLLLKPFTPEVLLSRVREMLDGDIVA
jgi:two-component system, cell cycle sensor histidine kinase and response regulator CckA